MAKLLPFVALHKAILGPIRLHPDSNVAEAWQTESFLGFCSFRQGYEENGHVNDLGPTGGRHLLDTNIKAKAHQPVGSIFGRVVVQ
jgi:hypothetical protein